MVQGELRALHPRTLVWRGEEDYGEEDESQDCDNDQQGDEHPPPVPDIGGAGHQFLEAENLGQIMRQLSDI